MKPYLFKISILILICVISEYGQSNSWNNLTPLHSTRADVEKLLGKPKEDKYGCCQYKTEKETVSVSYINKICENGWNVLPNTVLSISFSPDSDAKTIEALNLDKSKFSIRVDDTLRATLTNADEGISYSFSDVAHSFTQKLDYITYIPKKSDNYLRCDGFPPYSPDSQYYPIYQSSFYRPELSKKEDLDRIFALSDSFIIDLLNGKETLRGYIIIYFDNKLSLKEYKNRFDKLKEYIYKKRKVSFELFTLIEGGLVEYSTIEIYILGKDQKPPTPNPTLPSPQFMKNNNR